MEGPGKILRWEIMAPMDMIRVGVPGSRCTGSGGIIRGGGGYSR